MSDSNDKPTSEDERERKRQANLATMAHHSGIMVYFSSAYVTLVGLFSAGAFTAGLTVLSSDWGKRLASGEMKPWVFSYFGFFGASFLADLLAIIMVIFFSWKSFDDHRTAVYKGTSFVDARDKTKGGIGMGIIAFVAFLLLLFGFIVTLFLLYWSY